MNKQVLIVEDDPSLKELLEEELHDQGYDVAATDRVEGAMTMVHQRRPDLVISDVRLPGERDGLKLLETLKTQYSDMGFIVITAFGTIEQAVHALKLGADDFITKPLELDELLQAVTHTMARRQLSIDSRHIVDTHEKVDFHGILASSRAMRQLFRKVVTMAKGNAPVLILGESGTGKELLAKAVHAESPRAGAAFVPVNCANIPPDLLESEFFGHAKGAFTGADKNRQGLFQQAQGGTLFLDEIGEMPLSLQAKLLRAIQEKTIKPLGESNERRVDVRIVAATNKDLEKETSEHNFREDLFYRLEALSLSLPPLKERPDDKRLLTHEFTQRHAEHLGKDITNIESSVMAAIIAYPFPGNVRELENTIMRLVTLAEQGILSFEDLPTRIQAYAHTYDEPPLSSQTKEGSGEISDGFSSLQAIENAYIHKVLNATQGNKRRAAQILGVSRKTLYRRLEE
ncbi:sigma-54 dependent transcriptional regulator [Chromohalobacter canadensis]|uniref:sigma-54-dependent transcriptional regulator n=1 Tax=Chromohalobacter canadensis TaxID=141389 RepID=UPI0021C24048|nr:sigma-54 dependent transcriptional regulator [Chromohalobacter canadensis]MCT8468662.1 sigma-54 dependent transcriptional regulator [Chromohalobacter canadensis]MCT8471717.1 sigma-54 dependent transcriptional regulator [Chromohalobacter canadensis]MCT8499170.1 sigma-54 dependent transcriptional regulator [Chromohalobacter canadensis]